MNDFSFLLSNPIVNIIFVAWLSAQVLKTIINWMITKKFNPERLVGAGGMPSSHSALVCSLCIGIARVEGYSSAAFAISLALAGVVMYDAMGVRRAAGEQAKIINKMVFNFNDLKEMIKGALVFDEDESIENGHKRLKEYLGHTPMEVLGGALLGILVAMIIPI